MRGSAAAVRQTGRYRQTDAVIRRRYTKITDISGKSGEQRIMAQEKNMIQGFVPAPQDLFLHSGITDLHDSNWVFCEFRFRGLLPEISKLREYLTRNSIHTIYDAAVSGQVGEIRVIAEEKTACLIESFPALKVTGLAEDWLRQEIYVMYSESGFSGVTKIRFGGYFDRRHESGDGRWEWEYDMMETVRAEFTWLQTGEKQDVFYQYPFLSEWNWNSYTREIDGKIYVAEDNGNQDFEIENGVLKGYHGLGGNVVIPDTVREIEPYSQVFSSNIAITAVYISGSVRRIPEFCFSGCSNLCKVVFGNGVEYVDSFAFADCDALNEVILPESMTSLMPSSFLRCSSLDAAGIKLPAGIRCAGQAFLGCKNIPEVLLNEDGTVLLSAVVPAGTHEFVVPETVTTIGAYALYMDGKVNTVMFPANLRHIGEGAFRDCKNLVLKDLPDTLESVGACAFSGCGAMDVLVLPDSIKSVDVYAFGFPVEKIHLSGGIKEIPKSLAVKSEYPGTVHCLNFAPNPRIALRELVISEGTEKLEDHAFMGSANLKTVELPESLEAIGGHAFAHCISLSELKLPAKLKSMGAGAFLGCAKLKRLDIPEHIAELEEELLRDCGSLSEVSLPEKLRTIGKKAFRGCAALKQITIPDEVEEIGEEAFLKCTSLRAAVLPPSIQKIAGRAFKDCPRLERVEIPSTVTKIGAKAFDGCPNVVIVCETGSAAEKYVKKNGLRYSCR